MKNPYEPPKTRELGKPVSARIPVLNPARFLLMPIGLICLMFSVPPMFRLAVVPPRFALPTLSVCAAISGFGISAIVLSRGAYTERHKALTILWAALAMCAIAWTLTVDPPYGNLDMALAVATVVCLIAVAALALLRKPCAAAV